MFQNKFSIQIYSVINTQGTYVNLVVRMPRISPQAQYPAESDICWEAISSSSQNENKNRTVSLNLSGLLSWQYTKVLKAVVLVQTQSILLLCIEPIDTNDAAHPEYEAHRRCKPDNHSENNSCLVIFRSAANSIFASHPWYTLHKRDHRALSQASRRRRYTRFLSSPAAAAAPAAHLVCRLDRGVVLRGLRCVSCFIFIFHLYLRGLARAKLSPSSPNLC